MGLALAVNVQVLEVSCGLAADHSPEVVVGFVPDAVGSVEEYSPGPERMLGGEVGYMLMEEQLAALDFADITLVEWVG